MSAASIIRGLTLWRPWSASIVYGPKRVENRPWHPPVGYIQRGLWLAIHAGKKWDGDSGEFIAAHWEDLRVNTRHAALEHAWPFLFTEQGIVGVARVTQALRVEDMADTRDPWAFGPWCWMLDDVVPLAAPIPCRGAQGLWTLSPDLLALIAPLCVERSS